MPSEDRLSMSEGELRDHLIVLLGGRAAERMIYNETTVGAENDLERATGLARRMVTHWGMSERLGPVSYKMSDEDPFLGREIHQHRQFSERTMEIIDEEVTKILHSASARATELLTEHRDDLEKADASLAPAGGACREGDYGSDRATGQANGQGSRRSPTTHRAPLSVWFRMGRDKKKKVRADFRKNRTARTRAGDLTRHFQQQDPDEDQTLRAERISGKGDLTRKRTVIGRHAADGQAGVPVILDVDETACLPGRVLSVHGLTSQVQADDGRIISCATRRLLKTISIDQRHVVTAGDRVLFRPVSNTEGLIVRIEPRRGVLCRTSKGLQQVIVANVDQLLIVGSAAEPPLKPNLIDRFLVTAEKAGIRPVVCINKCDLTDAADLQPLAGVYGQMGYQVLLASATTGFGCQRLTELLVGSQTVVAGQSGVGKSSLLNAVEPQFNLRVNTISADTQKGRHTTTTAQLVPLAAGGYVVDTPGIRQFELWDVIPEEVAGYFRDLRPYVNHCRFPDCTHTHEADCAVKDAVADGQLDARRYESYCRLFLGEPA